MDEKERIIAEAIEKAEAEAKKQKLNKAQTKILVDEAVAKATEGLEESKVEEETPTEESKVEENKKTKTTQTPSKNTENKKTGKKYIVHTPVKNFNDEVAGVQFAYGKAEVKPGWILQWFKEHGYKIEEVSE